MIGVTTYAPPLISREKRKRGKKKPLSEQGTINIPTQEIKKKKLIDCGLQGRNAIFSFFKDYRIMLSTTS